MHVFVTGASGWVGSEVTRQLISGGHRVTGLARSQSAADKVSANGATPLHGALDDLPTLRKGAEMADAVIHCGFIHDFDAFAASVEIDRQAIQVFGEALAGTDKSLLVTSGTAGLALGRASTEEDAADPGVYGGTPRMSEQVCLALRDQGVRAGVVRLPPSVHGKGDNGFLATLVQIARDKGTSAFVGEGKNVWPSVHRNDAATVYKLALESGIGHPRYHAVDDMGVPFIEIATIIGNRLGVPVTSVPVADAQAHFGWMGLFAQFDVPASAELTQQRLGWTPLGLSLTEDLEQGSYFDKQR